RPAPAGRRRRSRDPRRGGSPEPRRRIGASVDPATSALRLASRTDDLGTEAAYLVLEAAHRLEAAGRHVAHLEIGEPDTPTPAHIIEAGVRALRDGHTRYAVAPGIPELRVAIAESLAERGLSVGPEHVVVTAGEERLAELAQQHDLAVLSDEVYGRIRYEGTPRSIAALPGMAERTVVVDAFSKTYAMTGWRLGYGAMPTGMVDRVTTLLINAASCTTTFVQHAGIAALRGPQDPVRRM